MTSLHLRQSEASSSKTQANGRDRRAFRRHDLEQQGIAVNRWNGGASSKRRAAAAVAETDTLGQIVDLSAGGVRIRTKQADVKPDHQIRVRLELPVYAGICPFVDTTGGQPQPKREWVGWMTVARVQPVGDNQFDVAGRLVDMEDIDRGMLGLYLSTQPLAA